MRRYFYDGVPCPMEDEATYAKVLTIAEMYADVLENGQQGISQALTSDRHEVWIGFCKDMLRSSPVLAELVRTHPGWWINLSRLLESQSNAE